jgi:putative FmdB family regulatory protein
VPTYEYHCEACGRDFEVKQRISEEPLKTHDGCGGAVRRLLSPAPFILKGEGWYVTDYPSASRKKAIESEKGGGDKTPASTEKPAAEKSSSASGDAPTTSAPSSTSGSSTAAS